MSITAEPVRTWHHIQWRLNDPAEERAQRWTRVHKISTLNANVTRCGIPVPDWAYMVNYDDQTAAGAPVCERCKSKG